MALQDDGMVVHGDRIMRQRDELSLYYGVYYNTHGDVLNVCDYISRAVIKLDGFVSADAAEMAPRHSASFKGSHLELNVGERSRRAWTSPGSRYRLWPPTAIPIAGDHATVTWGVKSDYQGSGRTLVQLRIELRRAKLYAFSSLRRALRGQVWGLLSTSVGEVEGSTGRIPPTSQSTIAPHQCSAKRWALWVSGSRGRMDPGRPR